ncbi:DUF2511 domain-containing protein [Scytonema millei]|uniref:DUF2511 domain-containing protein n=1 Tax=Scytonema millei VB511283 TaxID=1245923 RepID=A0A9X5E7S6_9CYAN|nr:DUF2511 domain-containing protein [Scytonema millei]NHC36895.1 DUF2511 domain-containing protein [Scytonema millei VB511283]
MSTILLALVAGCTSFNRPSDVAFKFPQASCGDREAGAEGSEVAVFIDYGDLAVLRRYYCADAFSTTRTETGKYTVQLASFSERQKALEFAKAVGGEIGRPRSPGDTLTSPPPTQPSAIATASEVPATSRAISEAELGEKYPFTVPEGTVRCATEYGAAVVFVTPDGTEYGVNGTADASKQFKDIHPIWKDDPRPGYAKVSLGSVIHMGLDLCKNAREQQ